MKWFAWLTAFALGSTCFGAHHKKGEHKAKVGGEAPKFSVKDETGTAWDSADHVGKNILVFYFYPADFTGGCTKQACGFRDDMGTLEGEGVKVLGVSGDSAETHALFKKAHKLNYTLLADFDGAVAKKFGVPLKKGGSIKRTIDGKEVTLTRGVTAARWTFVIGLDGKIAYINPKVSAAGDSKAVLKVIQSLKNKNK